MKRKDYKEEILQSKKEVGGEWRGLRSINVTKDSRNEKVKKRDEDGEKKEFYIYIYIYICVNVCVKFLMKM